METGEFKYQLFKTAQQWESGLFSRLKLSKSDKNSIEISLYTMPAFEKWIKEIDTNFDPASLYVDDCGMIYFTDIQKDQCRLYRYDPKFKRIKQIEAISGCGANDGEIKPSVKIVMDRYTVWIVDSQNSRVQAFSKETFQIKYIIEDLETPVSTTMDENGRLYILDQERKKVVVYENYGVSADISFGEDILSEPVDLAICKVNGKNFIYVLDNAYHGFLKFSIDGTYKGITGDFKNYQPSMIRCDHEGNIFTAEKDTNKIVQFDHDGSFIGEIEIPDIFTIDKETEIKTIAVDPLNNLYISTNIGIAFLNAQDKVSKEKGYYYSKTLDSGIDQCQWHRLSLDAALPPEKTYLRVYYHSSDDVDLKKQYESILSDTASSVQQKEEKINQLIPWRHDGNNNPGDMLFQEAMGRYLWIKIALASFDEEKIPKITTAKLIYPRNSYLRYLPAIYQEDPVSKAFLERFLSLFESMFYDFESDLTKVYRYFDPKTTPKEFLRWLGLWVNRAVEEEWDEDMQRRFIENAYELYQSKGTYKGIKRSIELYLNSNPQQNKVTIIEYQNMIKPLLLAQKGKMALGVNTLLLQKPVQGFRLNSGAILGRTALLDNGQSSEDSFFSFAHHFSVVVNLSDAEKNHYEKGIKKIIEEEKPAHTLCILRFANDEEDLGMWSYIGVNTYVDDYHAMALNHNAVLGSNLIAVDSGEKGGKVERHSKIGSPDSYLI